MPENTTPTDAVAALLAAWAPPLRQTAEEDPDDLCGCAGEDDDGRPMCNCAGGCSCESCGHQEHARRRTCDVPDCLGLTRYQVTPWRADGRTSVQRHEVGLTENPEEWITFGEQPGWFGYSNTACGREHAYRLAADLRARLSRPDDTPDRQIRVRIEHYSYRPDAYDLPESLHRLRELGESLRSDTDRLAEYRNPHRATVAVATPAARLAQARRAAAEAVALLASLHATDRLEVPEDREGDHV